MPREANTGSTYSPGLWNWQNELPWGSNITNRGAVNLQDFLTLNPSKLYGPNTEYLTGKLKGTIEGGLDPALAAMMSAGKRDISQFGDTARLKANQALSSSGFRGSGINVLNDIYKTQADSTADLSAKVGELGMAQREQAIAQLLGLNQLQTGVNTDVTNQQVGVGNTLLGYGQDRQKQDAEEAASGFNWGSFLGNIASAGATIGAAAISDKKMKKNIKDTGLKTASGLPIKTFKYKDDKEERTYVGHLAQEVEKKFPDAVYKVIDYNKLPDGIFQEVN